MICGLLIIFPYPAGSHVFQGPGCRVRVQGAGFGSRVQGLGLGSGTRVQGPGPGFRSSRLKCPEILNRVEVGMQIPNIFIINKFAKYLCKVSS